MASRVLVLSDIDGTLVDHPFLSGSDVSARRSSVERMLKLFRFPHFGLVTGRRKQGFERFFKEYDVPMIMPSFLAVEFATHLAVCGEWVQWKQQNQNISNLMRILQNHIEANSDFGKGPDIIQALQSGTIETFFMEEKTICAQIEAHFPSEILRRKFFSIVEEIVNPMVAFHGGLVLQSFPSMGRLDVLEAGFVPKCGFWKTIEDHRDRLGLVPNEQLTVVALGDELYDSYMFRYLREEIGGKLARIFTVSVGKLLAHATHRCTHPTQALSLVESIVHAGYVDDGAFANLEVVL